MIFIGIMFMRMTMIMALIFQFFFETKIPTFHPLSLFALPGPFSPSSDVLKPAVDVCT